MKTIKKILTILQFKMRSPHQPRMTNALRASHAETYLRQADCHVVAAMDAVRFHKFDVAAFEMRQAVNCVLMAEEIMP